MRKDRVWMKFKKEDFNQLMGVLSKQMERYSEIEAQNLNLKADIKDEKECLLDLQNKIWRYSHFEKESELITMDMFPSEVKNLFWTFLLNSFHEHEMCIRDRFCCDFQLLEKKCKEWIYDKTIEKHEKGIPMYKFSFQEKMTLLELTKDRHMIELLAVDHNEVIKNKATDKLKKIDEATKKVSPVHELLKQKETVPHKIYFTD